MEKLILSQLLQAYPLLRKQRTLHFVPLFELTYEVLTVVILLLPHTLLLVVFKGAFVIVARLHHKQTLSSSGTVFEVAFVDVSIDPAILSVAVGLSFVVIASVLVSVGKFLLSFPVLQETLEIACVFGASEVKVGSLAVLAVALPLALVVVSFG